MISTTDAARLLLQAGETPDAAVVELIASRDVSRHEAEVAVQQAFGRRLRRRRRVHAAATARRQPSPRLYVPLRVL